MPKRAEGWPAEELLLMKGQLPATVKLLALGAEISEAQYKKARTQYEATKHEGPGGASSRGLGG